MPSTLKAYLSLFALCLFVLGIGGAQQTIRTELRKDANDTRSVFLNTTHVDFGSLFRDRIELRELAAGQSGYLEFSFDHFEQSDIRIGLQHATDPSQTWFIQFLNGQVLINGNDLGPSTNGTLYRIERCTNNIRFLAGGQLLSEVTIPDPNFTALAFTQVQASSPHNGNLAQLDLQFPFINDCQAPPAVTSELVYSDLKKQLDGTFVRLTAPVLRFKYVEDYAVATGQNELLFWRLYDWTKAPPAIPNQSGSLSKRMGANYLSINLSIDFNEYYTLEVEDSRGEKQYLRMIYDCPTEDCLIFDGGGGDTGLQDPGPSIGNGVLSEE